MEDTLTKIFEALKSLKDGQDRLEMKIDLIQESVYRLEEGQPKDIVSMFDVLNKRIFRVETELEKLNRQ